MPLVGDAITVYVGRMKTIPVRYESDGLCKLSDGGCGARMLWCKTAAGRPMPVDIEPDAAGHRMPHFATCPKREVFIRRNRTTVPLVTRR